jgi:hypothetical protein
VPSEPAELVYFEPFDVNRLVALDNFITSNAFIARSALLRDLGDDPRLPSLEDLFLLLYFCRKTNFIFSYEATCEFNWSTDRNNDSVCLERAPDYRRVKDILWKQSFLSTQNVAHNFCQLEHRQSQLELELSRLNRKLAHTEGALAQAKTDIEVTTRRLNHYLNLPLIGVVRRLRRMLLRLPPPTNS